MKQYKFTKTAYGHTKGDVVELGGWDEFYLTRKKVIEPYHAEVKVVERESEIVLESPETQRRKRRKK